MTGDIDRRLTALEQTLRPDQFILVDWGPAERYSMNGLDLTREEFDNLRAQPGAVILRVIYEDHSTFAPGPG